MNDPFPHTAVTVGLRAPRLELTALTGETIGLDHYRGRPVLVSFLRHAG